MNRAIAATESWTEDVNERESMSTETAISTETVDEGKSIQSETMQPESMNNQTETEEDSMTGMYVYDGEVFYEEGMSAYMRAVTGKIDYTYWAIHKGADFGDILEDGRELDHVGIIMLKAGRVWKTAYCIHHNADLQGGHAYADVESYLTDTEKKELTGRALYHGFKFDDWTPDDEVVPSDADKGKYTATQVMVWVIEKGWYTYDNYMFKLTSKAINAAKTICAKSDQSPSGSSYKYFNSLYTCMQNDDQIPSFVNRSLSKAKTMNMGYDFSKKQYTLTLTDDNNILTECTISGMPAGMKAQKSGNQLILTSASPLDSTVTLKVNKKSYQSETAVTVWTDQDDKSYQQVGTYAEPDVSTMTGYVKIASAVSEVSAEKIWEDDDNKNQKRPVQIQIDMYRGQKKHEKAALVQTLILNEKNNWKTVISRLPGMDASGNRVFYTLEEKEMDGYDSSVKETCPDDYHWQYIFTNTENTGDLKLIKQSSNQEMVKDNACYSLEGAEYGVYADMSCTKVVGKLITDYEGKSNVLKDLTVGTYYVKELKRPRGYRLDADIHEIKIVKGEEKVLKLSDIPVYSDVLLQIEKSATDQLEDASAFPLSGTEFTVDFYADEMPQDNNLDNRVPLKSWVLQVRKQIIDGETVYRTSLTAENVVEEKSDTLYMDQNGNAVLPLGTFTIRETASAPDYKMEGYIEDSDGNKISDDPTSPLVIKVEDSQGEAVLKSPDGIWYKNLTLKVYDVRYQCSITIIKSDTQKQPLSGVVFVLQDEKGIKKAEGQTDKNGRLTFEQLLPGRYRLIETKTVDGQQLLKEPVEIQVPFEITEEEAESKNIDQTQYVYDEKNKVYKLYDCVYEISNSANFVLPMTGGQEKLADYAVLSGGLICLCLAAIGLIRKKENFRIHSFDINK